MRWVWNLRRIVLVVGWVAAVGGIAYAVNGMTQAHATVRVPVNLLPPAERSGWGNVEVQVPGITVPDSGDGPRARFAAARPGGLDIPDGGVVTSTYDGELTLVAGDSTRSEQLLARGGGLVGGVGILLGALALAPVLGSIAEGRPFAPGNARRLVVVAVTVAVAGAVAPMLPYVAGLMVLERTGLAGPRFASSTGPDIGAPVLVGLVVLAVAAAFRAGERMSDDVRGLV